MVLVVFVSAPTCSPRSRFTSRAGRCTVLRPGIFRKTLSLATSRPSSNADEASGRLGIHKTSRGWLYNVSGFDAVLITLHSGKGILLGTDEPERLRSAIAAEDRQRPVRGRNGGASSRARRNGRHPPAARTKSDRNPVTPKAPRPSGMSRKVVATQDWEGSLQFQVQILDEFAVHVEPVLHVLHKAFRSRRGPGARCLS